MEIRAGGREVGEALVAADAVCFNFASPKMSAGTDS